MLYFDVVFSKLQIYNDIMLDFAFFIVTSIYLLRRVHKSSGEVIINLVGCKNVVLNFAQDIFCCSVVRRIIFWQFGPREAHTTKMEEWMQYTSYKKHMQRFSGHFSMSASGAKCSRQKKNQRIDT